MRGYRFAFMECADSVGIVLYMARLRVMPSHYHAVSAVHMRSKVLDKMQKGEYACYARWSDNTWIPCPDLTSRLCLECLREAFCSEDVFIWGSWHTSAIIGVLWVVSLLWYISLAAVAFQWWWSVGLANYFLLWEHAVLRLRQMTREVL